MAPNILALVALAGTALAACPLSVEISSVADHVAQVAVTNTGNETITVFKGNTVLSEHSTKDLLVSAAGMSSHPFLPFHFMQAKAYRWNCPALRGYLRQLQADWSHLGHLPNPPARRDSHQLCQCCQDLQARGCRNGPDHSYSGLSVCAWI